MLGDENMDWFMVLRVAVSVELTVLFFSLSHFICIKDFTRPYTAPFTIISYFNTYFGFILEFFPP
jgi:hypothetical protein